MRTYVADIIPKIQRMSQRLDNITSLTNKHWVVIDDSDNTRTSYFFRSPGNELLITRTGKVEKAKWEYIDKDSLLIDTKTESYLFRHGFLDQKLLALKVDGHNEFAFLVIEDVYNLGLNSNVRIIEYLGDRYLSSKADEGGNSNNKLRANKKIVIYESNKGKLQIEIFEINKNPFYGDRVYINNLPAPNGKYRIGFMWTIHVKNGVIDDVTFF